MHWVQGTLPIPRELLQIPVASANRSPPIHGMCYSRRSWACIQVMGAGHNVFAVRARLEMQGTNIAARVVHGVDAEVHHMTGSVARSIFFLCYHTASVERLAAHNFEASTALLSEVVCRDWGDELASQEVLPVCNVPQVLADARAVEAALSGWMVSDRRASENGSPSVVVQRRVEFLAA